MAKKLSKDALHLLAWLRDHKHHSSEWLPRRCDPSKAKSLRIKGDGCQKTARAAIVEETSDLIEFPDWKSGYMFCPNAAGLAALERAGL